MAGMIAQTIQLALTPVFVLVAIGNLAGTLSNRLGRVVDRSRALQARHANTADTEHDRVVRELRVVNRRIRLINAALLRLVLSGLSIGLTVLVLFAEETLAADWQLIAAATFSLAIVLLMWSLLLFLRETRAATEALAIPDDYLELDRKL